MFEHRRFLILTDFAIEKALLAGFQDAFGEGGAGGSGSEVAVINGGGGMRTDPHSGGSCDGILIGGEENKFPGINLSLVGDHFIDSLRRVDGGRVFMAIGEDRHDDMAGSLLFRGQGESFAERVDSGANGVKEGGAPAG